MLYRDQKVVCVEAPWERAAGPLPWACPKLNAVYTIRDIMPWPNGRGASVLLSEIRNGPAYGGGEPAFCSTFFRPVAEHTTDISIFTKLLTPTSREVEPV